MANKVVEANEIYLNGTYYPLTRPVQSTLASIYPAKITIGDTTKDSQIRSSVISWSDWRGGIGVERMQGAADVDRAWYSTLNLRHRHHLVLSALANATTAETASGTAIDGEITFLAELGSTLYAGMRNGTLTSTQMVIQSGRGFSTVEVTTLSLVVLTTALRQEWVVLIT